MTKNNVFHKIPAQLLLEDRSVTFSGYLERKSSLLTFKHWQKSYVIISDGNLYIYPSNLASKPDLVCILSAFYQIEITKYRRQPPIWVFSLKPIIESVPELKFAAASEREMSTWITSLRDGIIMSKNKQLNRMPSIKERRTNDLESSIYSTVSERDQVAGDLLKLDQNSIYEEPDNTVFRERNTQPSAPPMTNLYPSLANLDIGSSQDQESITDSCLFFGSREEAFSSLTKCSPVGSYLVRVNKERQILTVKCETNIVKYCLVLDKLTDRICIAGQKDSFVNVYQLLNYYHDHYLPNQNCKLLAPYKLLVRVAKT